LQDRGHDAWGTAVEVEWDENSRAYSRRVREREFQRLDGNRGKEVGVNGMVKKHGITGQLHGTVKRGGRGGIEKKAVLRESELSELGEKKGGRTGFINAENWEREKRGSIFLGMKLRKLQVKCGTEFEKCQVGVSIDSEVQTCGGNEDLGANQIRRKGFLGGCDGGGGVGGGGVGGELAVKKRVRMLNGYPLGTGKALRQIKKKERRNGK